jgi:hypothetical protein
MACHSFVMTRIKDGWIWNGGHYDDEGRSGETLDRPGLHPMIQPWRRSLSVAPTIIDAEVNNVGSFIAENSCLPAFRGSASRHSFSETE